MTALPVLSNGVQNSKEGNTSLIRVEVPDVKALKCVVINPNDTVWAAKQVVMEKLNQDLPHDPLNYGLYMPPAGAGRLGKYLDDNRPLSEYSLQGSIPKLELRFKTRDYSVQVSLTKKEIMKANSKNSQKKLLEYIASGAKKKIEKLLDAGIDPNFITEDGNTPLGLMCGRNSHIACISSLLSGGAHIDLRGKDGLTAMHRAAIGGNAQAIMILLSFGASPNYRDAKGLTPVYHTAIMGDDIAACEFLLRYRADIGTKEQGGWTELHQTSKYGHVAHADLFIRYGADINAQNLVGNTPLHVAASHGQTECALKLLKRGADKMQLNFSSQSPGQVAILCGHHKLAAEINGFSPEQMEPITEPPDYDPKARVFDPKLFVQKGVSETCPVSPPAEALVGTLAQAWEKKEQDNPEPIPIVAVSKRKMSTTGSTSSLTSRSTSSSNRPPDTIETGSVSSASVDPDMESMHSESTGGHHTPGQNSPLLLHRHNYTFAHTRERLYRAGPGKYIAVEDVEPQQQGDIPLRAGMPVAVVYIGKGGFWEGMAGGKQGWFPAIAIKEVTSEENLLDVPKVALVPPLEENWKEMDDTGEDTAESLDEEESDRLAELEARTEDDPRNKTSIKEITVTRGHRGFGFAMRGVKATKAMKFRPSPQVPALQYVGNIDEGGAADVAGLETGDFILEVNGHNVTYSTHDDVVNIVRQSDGVLHLKVITPLIKPKSTSTTMRQQLTPLSTPERLRNANRLKLPPSSDDHSIKLETSSMEEPGPQHGAPRYHFKDSPVVGQTERTGWDSPQSQDDSMTGSLSQPVSNHSSSAASKNRFAYHVPPSESSTKSSLGAVAYPISGATSQPSTRQQQAGNTSLPWEKSSRSYSFTTNSKSVTLPRLPPRDYPTISETVDVTDLGVGSPSTEEEQDSVFTREIKAKKDTLQKQSKVDLGFRQRAATLPSNLSKSLFKSSKSDSLNSSGKDSAIEETEEEDVEEEEEVIGKSREDLRNAVKTEHAAELQEEDDKYQSDFEKELMQARANRSRRMSDHQLRITPVSSDEKEMERRVSEVSASISRNPIAHAVLRKIDTFLAENPDSQSDTPPDEFSSPDASPIVRDKMSSRRTENVIPQTKTPPPVKAKPQPKALSETVPKNDRYVKNDTSLDRTPDSAVTSPPWSVKLKSTPKIQRKPTKDDKEESGDDSQVDWRSVLKPMSSRERSNTPPFSPTHSAESNSRQLRQAPASSPQQPTASIAKVFESPLMVGAKAGGPLPAQDSMEGVSLYEESNTIPSPKYYQVSSSESVDESYWAQSGESGAAFDTRQLPPPSVHDFGSVPNDESFEAGELPPPLPPLDGRLSTTSLDLPPPAEFITIEGADGGETCTDDFIPPPLIPPTEFLSSEEPLSPLPPPLPESSPPNALTGSSQTFSFAATEGKPNAHLETDQIPSPVPSPNKPTTSVPAHNIKEDEINHFIPPPAFSGDSEVKGTQDLNATEDSIDEADIPPPLPSEPPPPLDFDREENDGVDTEVQRRSSDVQLQQAVATVVGKSFQQPPSLPSPQEEKNALGLTIDQFISSPTASVVKDAPVPTRPHPPTVEAAAGIMAGESIPSSEQKSSVVSPEMLSPTKSGYSSETDEKKMSANSKAVSDWDVDDVCQWLRDIGLGEHCQQFTENEIMGEHLADLSKDELKELGVKKLGHQKTFVSKVKELF